MSFADDVRKYCLEQYINPTRNQGGKTVSIRAGDVHKAMNYKNRMPLVCSAIGAKTFEELADAQRISIDGPSNGANAVFTFKLN